MALVALRPSHDTLRLVEALGGTWHGYSAMCCCPVHADHTPSLSIRQGERELLVTCFAGCDSSAVLCALRDIEPGTLPAATPHEPASGRGNGTDAARRIWDQARPVSMFGAARAVKTPPTRLSHAPARNDVLPVGHRRF